MKKRREEEREKERKHREEKRKDDARKKGSGYTSMAIRRHLRLELPVIKEYTYV